MLVDQLLAVSAVRRPEKPAIVCGGERWSYGRLDSASTRFARALEAAGSQPGDRVAICLDNSIDAVVSMFGALRAGCIVVVVNPRVRLEQMAGVLTDSGASVLVAGSAWIRELASSGTPLPALRTTIDAGSDLRQLLDPGRASAPRPRVARRCDTDTAALVYTSGSTGEPKGVMLTHRNITAAAAAIATYLGNSADDVILNTLPLSSTYGFGQLTTAFHVGATVVLERSFAYPRAILQTIERERVTGLPLVPTMATLLLRQRCGSQQVPTLRYITNAAAALSARKLRLLRDAFPHADVYSMYGLTECQRASYLPPSQLDVRPESVGVAIPGTRATVVDTRGRPAGAGSVGELVVRGPHVMAGYWNRPEATRAVLRCVPGSDVRELKTGDLFRTDEAGFLYFVERQDDIIKCGGEKVAPRHIERVIAELPEVAEVAVFGVPDDVLGEVATAVVTPVHGATLTPEQVQRHCLQRLDAHWVPKTVQVSDRMPTTLTGKVSRRMLRAAAMADRRCA